MPAPRWGFPHALLHESMASAWFAPATPPSCLSLFALYAYQVFCDSTCLSHNTTCGLYGGELGYGLHIRP